MKARAPVCAVVLGALAFANCRSVSLCADDAACVPRGGGAAGTANAAGASGGTSGGGATAGGTDAAGGAPELPFPPEAGRGGADAASGGRGGALASAAGEGGVPASSAGHGGDNQTGGNQGGGGACEGPWADCDGTSLNGCEVDLETDPLHCGACRSACDGLCSPLGCHTPTPFLEGVSFNSLSLTEDHVYVLTGNVSTSVRLWRVDKRDLSEELVAEDLPWFSFVTVAGGRIYLYGGGQNLWTGSEQGDFVDEGFEAGSVAVSAGVVYADRQGTLVARPEGATEWTPQPWLSGDSETTQLWPIDVSNQLCVLRESGDEGHRRYELFRVDRPDQPDGGLFTLASGSGELVRLRSGNGSVYLLVYEESGLLQLLRRDIQANSRTQVMASGFRILDFALDSSHVYVTSSPPLGYDLEVMSALPIGDSVHLGVRYEIAAPEADDGVLWFYGWDGMRRVELPVSEL